MNVLLVGHESLKRVNLLLSLTRISSDDAIKALRIHLVNGMQKNQACSLYCINAANFNRSLNKINKVASTVERIKEIDLNNCQLSD